VLSAVPNNPRLETEPSTRHFWSLAQQAIDALTPTTESRICFSWMHGKNLGGHRVNRNTHTITISRSHLFPVTLLRFLQEPTSTFGLTLLATHRAETMTRKSSCPILPSLARSSLF
jgi:hypothetical protein